MFVIVAWGQPYESVQLHCTRPGPWVSRVCYEELFSTIRCVRSFFHLFGPGIRREQCAVLGQMTEPLTEKAVRMDARMLVDIVTLRTPICPMIKTEAEQTFPVWIWFLGVTLW